MQSQSIGMRARESGWGPSFWVSGLLSGWSVARDWVSPFGDAQRLCSVFIAGDPTYRSRSRRGAEEMALLASGLTDHTVGKLSFR